jgi:hypothetical protein
MSDDTDVAGASRTISASAHSPQPADPTSNSAAVPSDEQAGARRQILRHILKHTAPAQLPARWSFLPVTDRVRTLHCDSPDLIASLQRTFSVAELQAARILLPGPEKEPQLVPVLRDNLVQVLLDASGEPIDLASDSGALFGADPPCFCYACQRLAVAGRPKRVFVTALEDHQVFECLGFRCTPAAGLASLDGRRVRRLYAKLSPSSRPRYRLTLVGASIANLKRELPSFIEPILKRLHNVRELYGYAEPDDLFELWRPSTADFERIRAAVTFSDRQIIRRAIRESIDVCVVSGGNAWRQLHAPDENDLESRHAALRRVIAAPDPSRFGTDLRAEVARLSATIEHHTTRRFLQAAAAASTPQESFALLESAEIIHHLNQNYGPLRAAKPRHGFSFHYDPTLTDERLEDIERCTNLLVALRRFSALPK